ncbi:ubiquinol-cytochrome C chaperone family protein [Chelatococcus reniformis]|uniref:Ubiquinol-cytochrome c chaperone n=1 Tax=Chelatococcus reniformis TaxID=1494448 RepID=A0A916XHN5_9HYPH|nr:ubiquinol-cytochrome C chaperone family protein [Chelatococcus reniformis]GGC73975.1 ubiquinol-cytochrome c chaperone [Chelatococcus reniformis]
MVFKLFKTNPRQAAIDALYGRIVEASRQPALYAMHGIPDTTQGRFESLAMHVVLVLRRLRQLPPPAADVAQELVDTTFEQIEHAFREIGIGDTTVPKRMKAIAKSFYGRAERYDAGLDEESDGPLAVALARNILDSSEPAPGLAAYARAVEVALGRFDLDDLLGSGARGGQGTEPPLAPDPAAFARRAP